MPKQVSTDLSKVLKGLTITADTVKSTMGPKGRNVGLSDPSGAAHEITNDGVFIASQISFEDREEDFGAYMVRNACDNTNDSAGDGTTGTAAVLLEVINEARKRPENAMEVRQSMFDARDMIVKQIQKISKEVKTNEQIEQVATISAESEEYGKMITEVIKKVGKTGTITIEDSRTFFTDYEVVDGYEAWIGYMSQYFITNREKATAEYDKVHVAVFQHKISTISDIKYLGELLQQNNISKLVIVCHDIDTTMLNNFVANYLSPQGLKNVIIRAANIDLLKDIASVVGATVVGGETGVEFDKMTVDDLGIADRVVATEKKTLFFKKDSKTAGAQSIRLKQLAENTQNQYEKEKYLERAAKLKGEIAVIRVGAKTDLEKRYLKKKLEDAVNATQSAIEEGVVEGGGMALYRIAESLSPTTIGEQIVKEALKAPLKTIIQNSGKDYTEIVKNLPSKMGYNAKTDQYVDLIKQGIIDPTKVVRCQVENAIGTAGTFITMSAIVTDIPVKQHGQQS